MTRAYADTSVPVERSKSAIEQMLAARHVSDTRFTTTSSLFMVEFNWPLRAEKKGPCKWRSGYCYAHSTSSLVERKPEAHGVEISGVLGVRMVAPWSADPAEQRRISRVLYWHLKTKLETVESGVLTFAEEFLPHLTLGRGRNVWDEFRPMLDAAVREGRDLSVDMEGIAEKAREKALPPGPSVEVRP